MTTQFFTFRLVCVTITIGVSSEAAVTVYLFDLLDESCKVLYDRQIGLLKGFLEDASVIKIIHDCRQDSDSLNEFFHITLRGVFDTSVYHMSILGLPSRNNLNDTLRNYSCKVNSARHDRDFYITHPNYWAERPLTAAHIACAAADVSSLFDLHERMLSHPFFEDGSVRLDDIRAKSERALDEFRSLRFEGTVGVPQHKLGLVIGKGGSVINSLQQLSGAMISKNLTGFKILGKDKETVERAKKMILSKANNEGYKRNPRYDADY